VGCAGGHRRGALTAKAEPRVGSLSSGALPADTDGCAHSCKRARRMRESQHALTPLPAFLPSSSPWTAKGGRGRGRLCCAAEDCVMMRRTESARARLCSCACAHVPVLVMPLDACAFVCLCRYANACLGYVRDLAHLWACMRACVT